MAESLDLDITLGDAQFVASGPSSTVMKAFAEFRELLSHDHPDRKSGAKSKASGKGKEASSSGEKIPFAVFMKHAWENQAARATAIVTWAKRYDNKDALKPGEMATYWKKGGTKKPANPGQVCINAERKGWLEKQSGGGYAVVGHGEQMVDQVAGKG